MFYQASTARFTLHIQTIPGTNARFEKDASEISSTRAALQSAKRGGGGFLEMLLREGKKKVTLFPHTTLRLSICLLQFGRDFECFVHEE